MYCVVFCAYCIYIVRTCRGPADCSPCFLSTLWRNDALLVRLLVDVERNLRWSLFVTWEGGAS